MRSTLRLSRSKPGGKFDEDRALVSLRHLFPFAASALAFLTVGCRAPVLPPVALNAPGWKTQETPAIWRPKTGAPEITGEILVSVHDDGSRFVQFSKGGLPMVTAQQTPAVWRIGSSMRAGAFGGRGAAPSSVLWFQIKSVPPAATAPPWSLSTWENGRWVILNAKTGEMLEGLDAP